MATRRGSVGPFLKRAKVEATTDPYSDEAGAVDDPVAFGVVTVPTGPLDAELAEDVDPDEELYEPDFAGVVAPPVVFEREDGIKEEVGVATCGAAPKRRPGGPKPSRARCLGTVIQS